MRTSDFVKSLRQMTETAPVAPAAVVAPRVDFETFETLASDPARTARAIVDAAKMARAGGPMAPKPSTIAQQILDAGAKRRGEA